MPSPDTGAGADADTGADAGAVVDVVTAGAGVLVVAADAAGAAGTAVEVLGVAVVGVEGADVLLELPLLKTVLSLFTYFPMLFLRSVGPSDPPGAGALMLAGGGGSPGLVGWYAVVKAYSSARKKKPGQ